MIPYFILLFIILLWLLLEDKAVNRRSFWVPLTLLTLFAGIRSVKVGTDSAAYTRPFRIPRYTTEYMYDPNQEWGYQFLEHLLLSFTHNYFWLFFITALITVPCYLYIFRKYSSNYILSIFLYIVLGNYMFFFNGLRQGIAMAITVLAVPFMFQKKFFHYLGLILIGSLFHMTALFMIPFYILTLIKIEDYKKILLSFFISLVGSSFLINYIASTNPRYEGYTELSNKAGGLVTLGFYVIVMLLLQLTKYLNNIRDEKFRILLNFYAIGVVFLIPVAMLGSNPSGPQRLLSYFTWTLALLLPVALEKINNLMVSVITIFTLLLYFYLTTTSFSNLNPYLINPIFKVLS